MLPEEEEEEEEGEGEGEGEGEEARKGEESKLVRGALPLFFCFFVCLFVCVCGGGEWWCVVVCGGVWYVF